VEKLKVARLDKNKGVSSYTSALMSIIFTSEEMAHSSMTGTVSNFQRNKDSEINGKQGKKELDPSVKEAIIGKLMLGFSLPFCLIVGITLN
jgi:hypothetical protein